MQPPVRDDHHPAVKPDDPALVHQQPQRRLGTLGDPHHLLWGSDEAVIISVHTKVEIQCLGLVRQIQKRIRLHHCGGEHSSQCHGFSLLSSVPAEMVPSIQLGSS